MIKYFKWIMFIILIISLIVTFVLFFDFIQDDNVVGNDNNYEVDDAFSIIYDKKWRRIGISYYENGKLVNQNMELNDLRFMVFSDNYVEYCDMYGESCVKYNYEYNEGIIFIDSEDFFVTNGTYGIVFDENKIELSLDTEDYKVIYHFS